VPPLVWRSAAAVGGSGKKAGKKNNLPKSLGCGYGRTSLCRSLISCPPSLGVVSIEDMTPSPSPGSRVSHYLLGRCVAQERPAIVIDPWFNHCMPTERQGRFRLSIQGYAPSSKIAKRVTLFFDSGTPGYECRRPPQPRSRLDPKWDDMQ
jgi:hypothetical protein